MVLLAAAAALPAPRRLLAAAAAQQAALQRGAGAAAAAVGAAEAAAEAACKAHREVKLECCQYISTTYIASKGHGISMERVCSFLCFPAVAGNHEGTGPAKLDTCRA